MSIIFVPEKLGGKMQTKRRKKKLLFSLKRRMRKAIKNKQPEKVVHIMKKLREHGGI